MTSYQLETWAKKKKKKLLGNYLDSGNMELWKQEDLCRICCWCWGLVPAVNAVSSKSHSCWWKLVIPVVMRQKINVKWVGAGLKGNHFSINDYQAMTTV